MQEKFSHFKSLKKIKKKIIPIAVTSLISLFLSQALAATEKNDPITNIKNTLIENRNLCIDSIKELNNSKPPINYIYQKTPPTMEDRKYKALLMKNIHYCISSIIIISHKNIKAISKEEEKEIDKKRREISIKHNIDMEFYDRNKPNDINGYYMEVCSSPYKKAFNENFKKLTSKKKNNIELKYMKDLKDCKGIIKFYMEDLERIIKEKG